MKTLRTADRITSADRDRTVRRLRDLTIGTALAGMLGVGGFGAVAAATHSGSTATSSSNDVAAIVPTASGATSTSSSTTPTASATTTTTPRRAQVSTGGS